MGNRYPGWPGDLPSTFSTRTAEVTALARDGVPHRVLFLTADEETLITRYKETRRRHPLAQEGNVLDGIRRETELLGPIRERAGCSRIRVSGR